MAGDNYRDISRAAVGQPIGEFYVLHFKGVIRRRATHSTRTTASMPAARSPSGLVGSATPFGYKNFELRGFLEFSHGAKVFNLMRIFADDGGYNYDNKFAYAMNRWQNPGDITNEPRASFDGTSGGARSPTASSRTARISAFRRSR